MAITSDDITFFYSTNAVTSANNTDGAEITSLGGAITTTEITSGQLQNLFDNTPASESSAGRTEYRCIYVTNENTTPQTLHDAKVYIETNTTSTTTTLEIALDAAGLNADSTINLADEIDSTSLLSALTWSAPADYASGLDLGEVVGNGGKYAVWVRRVITAGTVATSESATLRVQGETDA